MLMKKCEYKSPDLQQYSFCCERGFSLSTPIGDWEDGGEHGGSAD